MKTIQYGLFVFRKNDEVSVDEMDVHRRFLKFSPIRLRYCNLSFVATPDTMGLRHIDNFCEIVLHHTLSYDIVRRLNDSRTMTYDFTMIAW